MKTSENNIPDKKFIVSVGAGSAQEPFIDALKKKGYGVVAFGKGRNSDSVINKCDYFETIDTHDHEKAIKWLEEIPIKLVGAGSFAGGGAIHTLQKILTRFSLPTKISDSLHLGMNKIEQQKFYHQHGLSSIQTWDETDFNLSEATGYSFVVKPAIGRGSEGVKLFNRKEIQELSAGFLKKGDVIQSFIEGSEYRVLVMIQDSEVVFLAPVKRVSFKDTFFLGRLFYTDEHQSLISSFYKRLTKKLKINNAIIKSDIIVSNNNVNMIEMDIGVGGGVYYKRYISKLMGYDLTSNYIHLITNKLIDNTCLINKNLKMDYIFNTSGVPVDYKEGDLSHLLKEKVGEHSIVKNFLEPQKHGKCSSNSHFIFTVIHQNDYVTNSEINYSVNKIIFKEK